MKPEPLTMVVVVLKERADKGGALGFVGVHTKRGPWVYAPRANLGLLMFLQTCTLAQIKIRNKKYCQE